MMTLDTSLVTKVHNTLMDARHITLVTHERADGDAIGSTTALCLYLLNCHKDVHIVLNEPAAEYLQWLLQPIMSYVSYDPILLTQSDAICCLDFNTTSRVGTNLSPTLERSTAKKIVFDHHLAPQIDTDMLFSFPHVSSTCEIIGSFLPKEHLTREICTVLYAGLLTDTGAFAYSSSRPEVFELTAELLRHDIDKDGIYARMFYTFTPERLRLFGYALNTKMEIIDTHIALITLSAEELAHYHYTTGDIEGLVNEPLKICTVNYSILLRDEDGAIHISLRSKGDHPVNIMARELFGGGGHKNASGCTYNGTLTEAVEVFKTNYSKFFCL